MYYDQREMCDPFEAYGVELDNADLDPKTKERYWQVVSSYHAFLDGRAPGIVNAREFLSYLRQKQYRPRSILLYYHALRQFFNFLGVNFKVKIRKPRVLPQYYNYANVEQLIIMAEQGLRGQTEEKKLRNSALIKTLAFTGVRKSELLGLRVRDVDFERLSLTVRQGKGQKDRVIPLANKLVVPLRSQCQGKSKTEPVFHDLSARSVYRIVTGLARACGLERLHPHSLRHFFGTCLVERGANLRHVQELMGHADLETTAVYVDICAEHLKETITLLDR